MDREAGPVKAEMPSYQLLVFLALVIPGENGEKKNESFPLTNKFPLERLHTELGKAGKWSIECVTLSPASAVLLLSWLSVWPAEQGHQPAGAARPAQVAPLRNP